MNLTRCDSCGKEHLEGEWLWITLTPAGFFQNRMQTFHFCDEPCFWEWCRKNVPLVPQAKPPGFRHKWTPEELAQRELERDKKLTEELDQMIIKDIVPPFK